MRTETKTAFDPLPKQILFVSRGFFELLRGSLILDDEEDGKEKVSQAQKFLLLNSSLAGGLYLDTTTAIRQGKGKDRKVCLGSIHHQRLKGQGMNVNAGLRLSEQGKQLLSDTSEHLSRRPNRFNVLFVQSSLSFT